MYCVMLNSLLQEAFTLGEGVTKINTSNDSSEVTPKPKTGERRVILYAEACMFASVNIISIPKQK